MHTSGENGRIYCTQFGRTRPLPSATAASTSIDEGHGGGCHLFPISHFQLRFSFRIEAEIKAGGEKFPGEMPNMKVNLGKKLTVYHGNLIYLVYFLFLTVPWKRT